MPGISGATYRAVMKGTISSVQDWSVSLGIALTGTGEFTQAIVDQDADGIASEFETFANAVKGLWNGTTIATGLSVYYYPEGEVKAALIGEGNFGAVTGGGGGAGVPPQCAVVCTTQTNRPGRSGRGRMYLPLTSSGDLTNDGQLSGSIAASAASELAAMLTAINASSSASGGTFVCSILSQTMGLATAITRIQVDTVVDTQRRRRDKLGADAVHQADVTP